jgi:hypothetical protein
MASALNSLGRGTGRKFNMAAIKRELAAKREADIKKSQRLYAAHLESAKKPIVLTFGCR